jgi:hypothetical protein
MNTQQKIKENIQMAASMTRYALLNTKMSYAEAIAYSAKSHGCSEKSIMRQVPNYNQQEGENHG